MGQLTPTPRPYPPAADGSAQRPPTMTFTKRPSDFNHRSHQGHPGDRSPHAAHGPPETTMFGAKIPQPTASPKTGKIVGGVDAGAGGAGRFPHFPERRGELPPNFPPSG